MSRSLGSSFNRSLNSLSRGVMDVTGRRRAKEAAAESARRAEEQSQAAIAQAALFQKNLSTDLKNQDVATIEAGGSAMAGDETDPVLKKKRGSSMLASALGVQA